MNKRQNGDSGTQSLIAREDILAYEVDTGPADFSDRILQAIRTEADTGSKESVRAKNRTLWTWSAITVVAAAALILVWMRQADDHRIATTGKENFSQRGSVRIGERAVAVAEPGSKLSWKVSHNRTVLVEQESGNVFYRVEHGERFVVTTPAGNVTVLGTCFRVEVNPMKLSKKSIISGSLGAALTATVFVAVYEGRVLLANKAGATEFSAGQRGAATAVSAPARADGGGESVMKTGKSVALEDRERLRQENERLRYRVSELEAHAKEGHSNGQGAGVELFRLAMESFDNEARDATWASARESAIEKKLTRFFDVDDAKIECKTECCRLTFGEEGAPLELWRELNSSVGFLSRSTGTTSITKQGESGTRLTSGKFCFDRETNAGEQPNRALEREQLLARAAPALRKCAMQAAVPFVLNIDLVVDDGGAISSMESTADEIPDDAADCAVVAIMENAEFAPASNATTVPITISLDPAAVTDE